MDEKEELKLLQAISYIENVKKIEIMYWRDAEPNQGQYLDFKEISKIIEEEEHEQIDRNKLSQDDIQNLPIDVIESVESLLQHSLG